MIPPFLFPDDPPTQPTSSPTNTNPTHTTHTNNSNNSTKSKTKNMQKSKKSHQSSKKTKNNTSPTTTTTTTTSKADLERRHEQQLDKQLSQLGLRRKCIAKDGSCLFRACADVLFHTQSYHARLRRTVVDFMLKNRHHYRDFVFEMPFDQYVSNMRKKQTWAGHLELDAIAQCFRCHITIYSIRGIEAEQRYIPNSQLVGVLRNLNGRCGRLTNKQNMKNLKNGNFDQENDENDDEEDIPTINLCFLHGNHYDVLYPESFFETAGMCQSLFYDLVLKKGLGMEDVEPPKHAQVYRGYRNVEYDVYIGELRQMAALDQELAKQQQMELERRKREEEEQRMRELEQSRISHEIKTVVSTGKVIKAEEQYAGSWSKTLCNSSSSSEKQDSNGNNGTKDEFDMPPSSGADMTVKTLPEMSQEKENVAPNNTTVNNGTGTTGDATTTTTTTTPVLYASLAKTLVKEEVTKVAPPGVWSELSEGIGPIPGTPFLPIKSPLDPKKYEPSLSAKDYIKRQLKEHKRTVGMIIDLSSSNEPLYDYEDTPNHVSVAKLGSSTDTGMPTEKQIQQFITIVDEFRLKHPESYIVIHCLYGVNRTGIFACEYLIRKLGCTVEQALKLFAMGRGLAIYQPYFLDELFRRNNQTAASMFQKFRYPAFPSFVRETYMRNVQSQQMLEKRGLQFSEFDFDSMKTFDDLSQFDNITIPRACSQQPHREQSKKGVHTGAHNKGNTKNNKKTSKNKKK